MSTVGVIGGSAFSSIKNFEVTHREMVNTPYGVPSCPAVFAKINNDQFVFIHRHGFGHTISPHEINYRSNMWAMKQLGVTHIIAIGAVGGITQNMSPCTLVIPDQIIDYTHSRAHTYNENDSKPVQHVDFTYPYDEVLRQALIASAGDAGISCEQRAVYGATQGPRLETAAEINRLQRDGCDIVGMTGMPEAALARELELSYACCAVVANWAAGKSGTEVISMHDIQLNLKQGMGLVHQLLTHALPRVLKL